MPTFNTVRICSASSGLKIYTNARIICPEQNLDQENSYLITEGKYIKELGKMQNISQDLSQFREVNDLQGKLLIPGLVDIQVHFRDPGQTHKEDMVSGSQSAVSGGITSVVCQPNTEPRLDSKTSLEYLYYKAKEVASCNIFTYACVTKEMKGQEICDLESLAQVPNVVGFTDDGLPVLNSGIMKQALEISDYLKMPISQHAEEPSLSAGNPINEGLASAKLGLGGIPNSSEAVIVDRDLRLLERSGGHYHLLHVSTIEALDAIRSAKKRGLNVTCEVTPHHFALNEMAVLEKGTNAKMNPPLRSEEDRAAMVEGLIDGTIDAIATDHAPHQDYEKANPLEVAPFGIIGLETMLPISLELYQQKKLDLKTVISKLTNKAAKIVNIDRGTLQVGKVADMAIIDLKKEYIITPDLIYSRSKNTPFYDRNVKGIVQKTIVNGKIVFER